MPSSERIQVYLTKRQKEVLRKAAAVRDESMSDFMGRVAFDYVSEYLPNLRKEADEALSKEKGQ